jgi:Caspase domain
MGRKPLLSTRNSLTLAVLAASVFAQQPSRDMLYERTAQRVALIIGNEAYPKWPLRNPGNDAKAMAQALGEAGFRTEVVLNGSLRDMGRAVDNFVARIRQGDVALFYYAGHGLQLSGENYLVPVDFAAADEGDAKYASYSASRVQERMEEAGAQMSLVVLDACRNNPFRTSRAAGGGLAVMNTGRGTFIALATGPGKTADDNPDGRNGLFTTHLVAALREPGLTIDEIFSRVRERVYEGSRQAQLPWTVSSLIGTFRFNDNLNNSAAPPPPANPLVRRTENAVTAPPENPLARRQPQPPSRPIATGAAAAAAYQRGDFPEAIRLSQEVLRSNPADKDALFSLAAGFFRTHQYEFFVPNATSAVKAGVEFPILLGHHHTLTGVHPALLRLTASAIGFDPLGATECNQKAFQLPLASLVSIEPINGSNGEIFINVKVRDEQNKVRNLNFADRDSIVDKSSGLPVVRTPDHSLAAMKAIANFALSLRVN